LVQDTFAKAWIYLAKGGKISTMRAFLFHTLDGLIIDEYRKRRTESLDRLLDRGFEPGSVDSRRLFNTLDGKSVFVLIRSLPARYQKVMDLRYAHDMTLAEISALTGQTRNAIAVQLHRGLAMLKALYIHGRHG